MDTTRHHPPRHTHRGGKYSQKRLAQARREHDAALATLTGATFATIAAHHGCRSPSAGYKMVGRAMKRIEDDYDTIFARVRARNAIELIRLKIAREGLEASTGVNMTLGSVDCLLRLEKMDWRITGEFARFPSLQGRRPRRRTTGEWTEALELRLQGLSFEEMAPQLGLSSEASAYRRVERDLDAYVAGAAEQCRDFFLAIADKLVELILQTDPDPKLPVPRIRRMLTQLDKAYKAAGLYVTPTPCERKMTKLPYSLPLPPGWLLLGGEPCWEP